MTRKLTGRARSLAMVGGASLLLALALGVPELAAIGAGAVVVLLVGLHLGGESQVDLSVVAGGQRVVEGDAVALTIRVVTARRTTSVVLWVTTGGADPRRDRHSGVLGPGEGRPNGWWFHRRVPRPPRPGTH